jgi:hypothetical protein
MLIVAILAVLGIVIGLRFLRNVQPDDGEIMEDLKELKQAVAQFKGGLVPWTNEISANEADQVMEKGNARSGTGVFLSTDGQPIFAYAFRKYIGPGQNSLMYILTSDHELVFRTTTKGTEVTIDGQKQGLIRSNGTYYNLRNDEVAKVQRFGATGMNKIFIGNVEVAKLAMPDAIAQIRALDITASQLDAKQQELVRTMAVYELVDNLSQQA